MLFYQSYFPSSPLNSLVARYMIISDDEKHRDWQQLQVAPHGLSGLGFSFGGDLWYQGTRKESQKIAEGTLAGIHGFTYTIRWKDPINFLVVALKPAAAFCLLRTDLSSTRNSLHNLGSFDWNESEWVCQNLRRLPLHRWISFLETWLKKKLAGKSITPGLVGVVAEKIIQRQGAIPIKDLCNEFKVNRKYLERHFQLEMGSGPKEFSTLVRFNYLHTLLQNRRISSKELVYLGNFHDQSHLIKHFTHITGVTPEAFKKIAAWGRPLNRFVNKHNAHELILTNTVIPGTSSY